MLRQKLRSVGSLSVIALVVGAAGTAGVAGASNINTSATHCQNFNGGQALDIDFFTTGVRNINAAARPVICSVPRSPLLLGDLAQFNIHGTNFGVTTTSCTLTVHNIVGTVVAAASFTRGPGNWTQSVFFAAGVVGATDYVSLLCTLPGSGNGLIRGVTSRQ